jgi:hypothetical protein
VNRRVLLSFLAVAIIAPGRLDAGLQQQVGRLGRWEFEDYTG